MSKYHKKTGCKKKDWLVKPVGKKGFIADVIVDFWAYITFVLVIIVFAFLYKLVAKSSMERLSDFRGVTWSNHLASVYLRTPIEIGDTDLSMAELIALYDYNQTHERVKETKAKKESWTDLAAALKSTKELLMGNSILKGSRGPLADGLFSVTDDFIEDNFDAFDTCYLFYIKGNGFEYMNWGSLSKCKAYARTRAEHGVFGFSVVQSDLTIDNFLQLLDDVPKESYLTYIPAIDPREKPIELYVVYDFEKILRLKDQTSMSDDSESEEYV